MLPRGDGLVGDAISIAGTGNVVVDGVLMTNAVRAGLSCFGAAVELRDNEFRCNAIDLNGETWGGTPFALDYLGGNACGCGDSWTCKVQSSSLSPPSPSEDEELPTIEEPD